jgi:hypothetical protein
VIPESPEAQQEREQCPVCLSPLRRAIEHMRYIDRAGYAEIHRALPADAVISLRAVIRHFTRGHESGSPRDVSQLPAWLLEDDAELERYMREQGYCRTIEDLCPHVPAGTISTCDQIGHPECERFRLHLMRERLLDMEMRVPWAPAPGPLTSERVMLTEPLVPQQRVEVETPGGSRRGIFASTVLAIDPALIAITALTRLHETLPLAPGDRVRVSYQGRTSKYVFETTVRAVRETRVDLDPPATIGIASRRSPRIPLRDSVVRIKRIERGGEEVTGTALDVGAQGMRIVMAIEIPQWERVQVTVSLPDGPLVADGEVVRVERMSPGQVALGLYFVGVGPDDLVRLRRLGG